MRRIPGPVPDPPAVLHGEARAEWGRVAPDLHRRGLLGDLDHGPLVAYCLAWARLVDAEERLRAHGPVIVSPSGCPIQSPYMAIAVKAGEQLLAAAAHFGMTPATRAAVVVEDLTIMPFREW